jgi:hypothetical protein
MLARVQECLEIQHAHNYLSLFLSRAHTLFTGQIERERERKERETYKER